MLFPAALFATALLSLVTAQPAPEDLAAAIKSHKELSKFESLLWVSPEVFTRAVQDKSSNVTVLVPTDDAISDYLDGSKVTKLSDLPADKLETFLSYHILPASLKSYNFDTELVIPTLLTAAEYNNRSAAGTRIAQEFGTNATGQVLITSKKSDSNSKRDNPNGPQLTVRGGLGEDAKMTVVDGQWGDSGINAFQVVDKVLAPPMPCSNTIRSQGTKLSALDESLNKTALYPTLDTLANVTCLAPNTDAFGAAGSPNKKLSNDDLAGALKAHTLKGVAYASTLTDGMEWDTVNQTKVRVYLKGDDIYFNNAKVIEKNVLTNNGLIHILDSVIDSSGTPPSGTSTSSPSGTDANNPFRTADDNAGSHPWAVYHGVVALVVALWLV